MKGIFNTNSESFSLFITRVVLGVVILPHGLQKVFGLFGGYGYSATVGFFESMGIPSIIAILIILAESAGAIGLIAGFLSRFCAFGLAIVMLGAMFLVHLPNGFFMNWTGNQKGEGIEYHILVIGLALVVLIGGSGRWSIDSIFSDN
ncbi:MAG: DoxX family protein [Thermodesulfobacteriota bacterium]